MSLWTLASRVTGLVRETLMAALFGASAMTDAFNVAFRIPNLFRRMFAEGAFSQAFVPVLAASKAQQGDAATKLLIDYVATLLAWAMLLVCMAGVILAPWMVWAMASGLPTKGFDAAVWMTRFMFPYIGCMSLVALSSGVLNTYKRFAIPAATPVLLNVSTIAAAWWVSPWFALQGLEPIYAMALGVMVGGLLQLGIQIPALAALGLLPRLGLALAGIKSAWNDPGTRTILRLMGPALLGVSVAQISLLINTQLASHLASGSVSWLSYADRLMEFPTAMLGVALGVVLMPRLAAARATDNTQDYSQLLDWGLRIVVLLATPCAVALLVFAQPLVAVLFHYRAFTAFDVQQTALALTGWGVGLVGLVAIKVLAPGYYASQDVKTPVRIAVVVLVITQLLNWALVPLFRHAALSLSISLGALLNALWLMRGLKARGSYRPSPGWWRFGAQVGLACLLLGIYLGWAAQAVNWLEMPGGALQRALWVGLTLLGAALVYGAGAMALGLNLRQFLRR